MKDFMDKDFLLGGTVAKKLYHNYAEKMPIIDYHCHIVPKEIADDIHFENITQVWLKADHYKWRFMRSCGVEEKYITGDASDHDKFIAWAKCLGRAIGNPLYHWSHLELQRYFGIKTPLNEKTAEEIWNICNKKLQGKGMSARDLIKKSNVSVICTTDDPIDALNYHEDIKNDQRFDVTVLPAWRPDKAMYIEKETYVDYIDKLSEAAGFKIMCYGDLIKALKIRMDYFESKGCKVSDHGLFYVMYNPASKEEIEAIFQKSIKGETISFDEELKFKTDFMLEMCKEYKKKNWVLQLHYGVKRDNNTKMFNKIGPDTGFDCIMAETSSTGLVDFLNAANNLDSLPKTIIYSLNPEDNAAIGSIIGCFQDSSCVAKIQHGSAWWFNDNKPGMEAQIKSLASLGNLSGFVGMLTDSRSFLSYTRHEYFRRILCNIIGEWVENGEFPEDYDILSSIVEDISYNNALRYFNL